MPEVANSFIFQNIGNPLEGWFPAIMAYVTLEMAFPDKLEFRSVMTKLAMTSSTIAILDNEIFNVFTKVVTADIFDVPAGLFGLVSAGLVLDRI
jgi:hypothetical protein